MIEIPHPGADNHNGGQRPVRARRPPLPRDRRRRWLPATRTRTPRTPSRCSASSCGSTAARRRGGYADPGGQPVRGGAGRRRDLRARAAQPVPVLVRPADRDDRDRRRRPGRLRGGRLREPGAARGANFGWDAFEGRPFVRSGGLRGLRPRHRPPTRRPIHQYAPRGGGYTGCAVIGGFVVRDRRLRGPYGRYVFADFCNGELRSLVPRPRRRRRRPAPLGVDVAVAVVVRRGPQRARSTSTSLTGAPSTGSTRPTRVRGRRSRLAPRPRPATAAAASAQRRSATFSAPDYVTGPEGADGLVFVAEQAGVIRLVKDGRKIGGTFLDIRGRSRPAASRACSRSPSRPTTRNRPLLRLLHRRAAATS